MKLSFITRDLPPFDYPKIGWIGGLPVGADALWGDFGNFHAAEYPEIILRQKNGKWQLYLSAIDSGRTDDIRGTGRDIRIDLYITGNVGDGSCLIGLIKTYLLETLSRQSREGSLRKLFSENIKQGDPQKWAAMSNVEKEDVAKIVLEKLGKFPCISSCGDAAACFVGGAMNTGAQNAFLAQCEKLLSGASEGIALSLANLSSDEVNKVFSLAKINPGDSAAVLLTVPDESDLNVKSLSSWMAGCSAVGQGQSPAGVGQINVHSKPGYSKVLFIAALVTLGLFSIIFGCDRKGEEATSGKNDQVKINVIEKVTEE